MSTFSSGILLLEHLRTKETFDLYLLDVIMPGLNGIELGVGIREFDQGGYIIYLTTSADFAVDSYRAKASDYLLKPLDKERLFRALESVMERLAQEGQAFMTIKTREGLQRLPHWSIVYGELAGRWGMMIGALPTLLYFLGHDGHEAPEPFPRPVPPAFGWGFSFVFCCTSGKKMVSLT